MSDEAASRSPEPEELLRAAVSYFLRDVHTAMPARIEEYFPDEQKVDVKPLIQRRVVGEDGQEFLEELPIIPDVPVCFPRTANFFLTFPLVAGDLVLLVFAERSLDNWLAGTGEDTDPDEFRMHDLSDAVAMPGLYPFSQAIVGVDTERMSMGHKDGGMAVNIAQDHVEVTFDNGSTVKLEAKDGDATMTVGDGAKHVAIVEALEQLYTGLQTKLTAFDAHVHPTGVGPSGPPAPAIAADPWDPAIASTKVSIPDG